jgi:hypothetical protein
MAQAPPYEARNPATIITQTETGTMTTPLVHLAAIDAPFAAFAACQNSRIMHHN